MMITVHRAVALLALLTASSPIFAQSIPGYGNIEDYDPREIAMLPRYCTHTQLFRTRVPGGDNPAEIARWKTVMGPTFMAMHHYCWGLMSTNRALFLTQDKQLREFFLGRSIGEFDYVLREAPPDFVLLPEILTKKGENLIRLGKGGAGVAELERAISLKPDYWPPYVALSDYFRDSGDTTMAREVAQRGLSHSPDVPLLKRRLAALGKHGAAAVTK